MAYWLLKTEPEEFSWDDQVKRGAKGETWSGVRNFTARRHLKEMKKGEKFFFYHTGDEKSAVGIASVVSVDPTDPKTPQVKIKVGKPLAKPVTLAEMKANKLFADSPLVRQGRLSVVPLTDAQHKFITG